MVTIRQGGIHLQDFGRPNGSLPAKTRPVVVIQGDDRNASNLKTTIVLPFTSKTNHAAVHDNVFVPKASAGLNRDSVILTYQPVTVNKSELGEEIGVLPFTLLNEAIAGLRSVIEPVW